MWVNLLLVLLYWIAAGLVLGMVMGRMIAFADKALAVSQISWQDLSKKQMSIQRLHTTLQADTCSTWSKDGAALQSHP
jgi:endonuclease/exonuclease/phosphatase (EEP) superfamily protein YafD